VVSVGLAPGHEPITHDTLGEGTVSDSVVDIARRQADALPRASRKRSPRWPQTPRIDFGCEEGCAPSVDATFAECMTIDLLLRAFEMGLRRRDVVWNS
jgi:hypothetical protein